MTKTILITGASSDMAMDLIQKIHDDYDTIIAHYNSSKSCLEKLKDIIGKKLILLQADFRNPDSVDKFIEDVANISEPDCIIHFPASKLKPERFEKSSPEELTDDIMIQLFSIYKIAQRFIKGMSKKKGSKIIFILTSAIFNTPKFNTNYLIPKYALLGLMKSLAKEYEGKVQINAVSPSMTETKFLENLPEFVIQENADKSPLKRNLRPDDITKVIETLLTDDSEKSCGQNILIDNEIKV